MEQAKREHVAAPNGIMQVPEQASVECLESPHVTNTGTSLINGTSADRKSQFNASNATPLVPSEAPSKNQPSKTQQKRSTISEPRPPPQRPILPEGISPPQGEENWIALWDLPDYELERRVLRAKKKAAAARKALRVKQQSGKVERRAARDEKRKVYRDLKLTWKTIKGWSMAAAWMRV